MTDAPLSSKDWTALAVNAIFEDIRDRRALKWFFGGSPSEVSSDFSSIDDETQIEIAHRWREIIEAYEGAHEFGALRELHEAVKALSPFFEAPLDHNTIPLWRRLDAAQKAAAQTLLGN